MSDNRPPLDPHPLSEYVAWAGNRNRGPILEILKQELPDDAGDVLEFASGSGMHINYFAPHFRHLTFYPSDKDQEVFENIETLAGKHGNENISKPTHLDLTRRETWQHLQPHSFAAIYCINIFQVAPISIADGMMECASYLLQDDGFLMIYGPFRVEGQFTTDSNREFHETLSSYQVPEWGLKDVADLQKAAAKFGLELKKQIGMPANNFSLIFAKGSV